MKFSLTLLLASWGAALSTVSILWNIRRDLSDKGRLKVNCYLGRIVGPLEPSDQPIKLVYCVTNTGRRPIVVNNVGGSFKDRREHFILQPHHPFPRTLQPGEYFLEWSDDLSVLNEPLKCLWATDSLERYWKLGRNALRELSRKGISAAAPDNPVLQQSKPTGLS